MLRSIQSLRPADLAGKVAFVRVDYNTPMKDGQIVDDSRIRESLPSIQYLREAGAKVLLCSHLGRPKGVDEDLRLTAAVPVLSNYLGIQVQKSEESIGDTVKTQVAAMENGDVLLLENCRFHAGDTKNDAELSQAFADLADIFVLDAFSVAHRKHSSSYGVGEIIPAYAGALLEKEVEKISSLLFEPKRPVLAIVGGAKVSTKITVLEALLPLVDNLVIGGGMAFTFLHCQGYSIGKSLLDEPSIPIAQSFLEAAGTSSTRATVHLPVDVNCAKEFSTGVPVTTVSSHKIPDDQMGLDIGPESLAQVKQLVEDSETVFWNGPLGVAEIPEFAVGTESIARLLAESDILSVVGGGDSVAAIKQTGVEADITHISTGGGAALEFIEKQSLPGIELCQVQNGSPACV